MARSASAKSAILKRLYSARFDRCFNPYLDVCEMHDSPGSVDIRRNNVEAMLDAMRSQSGCELWIGRDLGYRGGRRTGLPLTDEVHLTVAAYYWGTAISRATLGEPAAERTAKYIWKAIRELCTAKVFLWNLFPLHPHLPGEPLSNRPHTNEEAQFGLEILAAVVKIARPVRIIAVGGDAGRVLGKFQAEETAVVRHPSFGGHVRFLHEIGKLHRSG